MVNSIGTSNLNPIQMLNAVNAFKSTEAAHSVGSNNLIPDTSDGMDVNDTNVLNNQDTDEIKKFAKTAGEDNLSNDDIKYGLTYGRSVIADFVI